MMTIPVGSNALHDEVFLDSEWDGSLPGATQTSEPHGATPELAGSQNLGPLGTRDRAVFVPNIRSFDLVLKIEMTINSWYKSAKGS